MSSSTPLALSSSPSHSNSSLHPKDLSLLDAPSEDTQTFLVFYRDPLTFQLPRSSNILSALEKIRQMMVQQSPRGSWGDIASSISPNLYSIRRLTGEKQYHEQQAEAETFQLTPPSKPLRGGRKRK